MWFHLWDVHRAVRLIYVVGVSSHTGLLRWRKFTELYTFDVCIFWISVTFQVKKSHPRDIHEWKKGTKGPKSSMWHFSVPLWLLLCWDLTLVPGPPISWVSSFIYRTEALGWETSVVWRRLSLLMVLREVKRPRSHDRDIRLPLTLPETISEVC